MSDDNEDPGEFYIQKPFNQAIIKGIYRLNSVKNKETKS